MTGRSQMAPSRASCGRWRHFRSHYAAMVNRKGSPGVRHEITIPFNGGVVTGHYVVQGEAITVTDASGHSKTTQVGQTPAESLARVILAEIVTQHSR